MNKEFNFWVSQRMVNLTRQGNQYSLARYDVEVDSPRPGTYHLYTSILHECNKKQIRSSYVLTQLMVNRLNKIFPKSMILKKLYKLLTLLISESYREDYENAKRFFTNKDDEQQFYINMKSGAESGWDYSTKW